MTNEAELDRWTTLAMLAVVIAANRDREQWWPFVNVALTKFADVPDKMPDDMDGLPAYAVKRLLQAVAGDPDMAVAAELTNRCVEASWPY